MQTSVGKDTFVR